MIGYPFFYRNDDLDHDKKFLRFYLDPITENSKLNSIQVGSLPILVETTNLELGDKFTYQFCDQISQLCKTYYIIPETKTLVLDYDGFCNLASNSDMIISNLSYQLEITKESALQQAQNFFSDKNVIVQAKGVQGALYKVGTYFQAAGSAGLVANTIALAKLAGVSGLQILKAQPYLAVAIPTTGAMFFYGCGAIVGNNTVGKVLVTTGDILSIPMKGTEMMWNSYVNPVIQKVFGIPLILNMTQTFKTGPGYTIEEVSKYVSFNQKPLVRAVKDKIIHFLS